MKASRMASLQQANFNTEYTITGITRKNKMSFQNQFASHLSQRQQHFQQGTAGGVVAGLNPATMGERDLAHDRQAEPSAAPAAAGAARIAAVEAFEHSLLVFLAETWSAIADRDPTPTAPAAQIHRHALAIGAVAQGVIEQVVEEPMQA
jgi:hypothetical protein